jgi:hypothetical protein
VPTLVGTGKKSTPLAKAVRTGSGRCHAGSYLRSLTDTACSVLFA